VATVERNERKLRSLSYFRFGFDESSEIAVTRELLEVARLDRPVRLIDYQSQLSNPLLTFVSGQKSKACPQYVLGRRVDATADLPLDEGGVFRLEVYLHGRMGRMFFSHWLLQLRNNSRTN
jgi:hypothetical protein